MRATASVLAVAAAATLASAAPASAAHLTARQIRIADRPGVVRVVVDFTGGHVLTGEVVATDPDPFADGVVRLPLTHAGVRTIAPPVLGAGVSARVVQGSGRIVIRLAAADRRFKYVGYHALRSPDRLVIDLYKSEPPSRAAEIRRAPDRCLTLRRHTVGSRRVSAGGRARNLFENSFVVRLRRAGGRIHDQQVGTAAAGRWSTRFRYPRTHRRTGTLEVVAQSAKDGTLECIVQVRVRFGG
jgi:hypothetical protein